MGKMKQKFSNLTIKSKIFLYLIGFCILLISMLWIFQVLLMTRFYGNIRMSQMENCRNSIEYIIKTNGDNSLIDTAAWENEACVMILSSTGQTVYSVDTSKNCKIHKLSNSDIRIIIRRTDRQNGRLKGVYREKGPFRPDEIITNTRPDFDSDESQSMIYCTQIKDGEDIIGYLLINIQLSPVQAAVSAIRRQLGIISVIIVAFSFVLATIISRRISKPIEKLAVDVAQLSKGDYNIIFNATGYKEINALSDSLTQTAEDLGRVEQLRKDFIANVSHDLRTPLTLIGGYAEVMRDIPGENNAENAQLIIAETKRLSTFVTDLLDMSKMQSGAQPMEKTEYNLTQVVAAAVDNMRELLKHEGYDISFIYDKEISVTADKARVSQCFYNILINAVNYTGEDKKIIAEQEIYDNMVRISVTDTGSGIAEKDIPYIWERYYKNDQNHKRAVTGTGLGLSIVRTVIKEHNGLYGAYNTKEGGACFWFSLPI